MVASTIPITIRIMVASAPLPLSPCGRSRPDLPTEEEQYQAAIRSLGGGTAAFRTLDLGGDKLPAAVDTPDGPIPTCGSGRSGCRCEGLGVRELSRAPGQPSWVRSIVAAAEISEAEELMAAALALGAVTQVRELVTATMVDRFREEMSLAMA